MVRSIAEALTERNFLEDFVAKKMLFAFLRNA